MINVGTSYPTPDIRRLSLYKLSDQPRIAQMAVSYTVYVLWIRNGKEKTENNRKNVKLALFPVCVTFEIKYIQYSIENN